METTHVIVAIVTIVANTFSGLAAITKFGPVMRTLRPALATAGIPESWLVFPIGTLKLAGALGIAIGLFGFPWIGTASAIGLVLYFVCAAYTHVRVSDYVAQFYGAVTIFLPLAVATTVLGWP
ncbi:DoxX family protein [Nocardia jinanensis]|uniref:Membrane protein n=1 Tax=Nocardia jinanensis TaxID=382504 RepID=A0A917RZB0_9NOCA|nr:DoxX family protein [Nocardia jinanensis]GGL46377.1 membrane protein [Nocardia jinanensis]